MFGQNSGWENYIFLIVIVLLLVWSMTRRRKTGNTSLDAAAGILSNITANLKILEERQTNWQSKKKFQTSGWKIYGNKLEFLDPSLLTAINESFTIAEDLNSRIDSARKNRAMATLQDMPLEKLRAPLTKSKEGLTLWIRTNYQAETQNNQRRGCSGF